MYSSPFRSLIQFKISQSLAGRSIPNIFFYLLYLGFIFFNSTLLIFPYL
jgi:hypothetical protein